MGAAPVRPARVTPKSHGATTKQDQRRIRVEKQSIGRVLLYPTGLLGEDDRTPQTAGPTRREARLRKVIVA